jgi:putative transposase
MGCSGSGVAAAAALPRGRSRATLDMKALTVAEVGGNPRPVRSSATALSSVRGKETRTTIPSKAACPADRVNRQFRAVRPNLLWLADFTYVATWQGFVYVAFVIDAFARRIVGWRVSKTAHASFVLDALEQALHDRRPIRGSGLVHHSDRGVQYVSVHYTERLAEAGIDPSVGSAGDSYDNALAETVNGLLRPRSSAVVGHGAHWKLLNSPRSNGWIGSTTVVSSSRSETCRLPRLKSATMLNCRRWPWQRNSNQPASGKPGAVHSHHTPSRRPVV